MKNLPTAKHFAELYDTYHKLVRNVLYRMCGMGFLDDLVQEAFLRIWRGLREFEGRSSIKTWVYTIAYRTAVDHLRENKYERDHDMVVWDEKHAPTEPVPTGEQKHIMNALAALSEEHRGVIVLCVFEEFSLEETAEMCEVPVGTVKSRLHTAKKRLKELLEEGGVSL